MKNNLSDVKNHLIAAMERLNDEEMVKEKEDVEREIEKAKALSSLAEQIVAIDQVEINNKNTEIAAMKTAFSMGLVYRPSTMKIEEAEKKIKPITLKDAWDNQ